ncbi:MAG: DNA polymerase III subunit delta, partial [Bacteroidota bacterium]
PYFIDRISGFIENKVLAESEREFNQSVLYGQDTDVLRIISEARRFPMMSERMVVIVKEAQNIRNLAKDDEGGKSKPPLLAYLDNPQPTTLLVFCYKNKTLDKRTSLAKALDKKAVLFESKKLYDDKIPDWVISYLKERKYSIHPRAALLIAESLGNDLGKVANELDKLMLNIARETEISEDHVHRFIGISKEYNVFELQNALGRKDVLKANRIVNYFAANPKDNPFVVTISNLFGFYNKLLTFHMLKDKSRQSVAAALKVNPFFVGDYERAARNYSAGKVIRVISDLREYDLRSKGFENVSTTEGELLKELVFRILH